MEKPSKNTVELKDLVNYIVNKTGQNITMEVMKIIHHTSTFMLLMDYFNIVNIGII